MGNLKTMKRSFQILIGSMIGIIVGINLHLESNKTVIENLCNTECLRNDNPMFEESLKTIENLIFNNNQKNANDQRKLLLVGIMTANKFIDTRSNAIFNTWAKHLHGDVLFFSSQNSTFNSAGLPVISLPGVDDRYPPQKKSFIMFKFLHDYFGDQYKFFMRADDDVYINVERLREFLTNLNDSEPLFLGQTGVGNNDEFGQLNLNKNENFCMGGPGMIMSRITLQNLSENVGDCLKNLQTTHEDVEIGRCVHQFAKTSCTWSYDMQRLFYHNQTIHSLIENDHYPSTELSKAITIHPIKDPTVMLKLYQYYQQKELQISNRLITDSYESIVSLNITQFSDQELSQLLLFNDDSSPNHMTQVQQFRVNVSEYDRSMVTQDFRNNWKYFDQKIYNEQNLNPKQNLNHNLMEVFKNNMPIIMAYFNRKSMKMSRILDINSLYYGFYKNDPFVGSQYLLDLSLTYRKYYGKRLTIPIRRYAYAIQNLAKPKIRVVKFDRDHRQTINIVVPLYERKDTLLRLLNHLKNMTAIDGNITVTLMMFTHDNIDDLISNIGLKVPLKIHHLQGQFSRGLALEQSLQYFSDNDLLFFLDVDMMLSTNIFDKVRRNTIRGVQVYYPIVFSQYETLNHSQTFDIHDDHGYWRQFGFGICSIYKSDLNTVGGYDSNITGWGLEDVSLYDRIIRDGRLRVFRSVENELVHVYHSIICRPSLSARQYEMCLGTLLSTSSSTQTLARTVLRVGIF